MTTIYPEASAGFLAGDSLPEHLAQITGNKDVKLQFLGNSALADKPGVGICGSRKASDKSLTLMRESVTRLVEDGYVIVSSNAAGIDRQAHLTALRQGGETILALPLGIGHFRIPADLRDDWDWARALVVSQFAEHEGWAAWRAMHRNRTIIGLSRALMVTEAGDKGGTVAAGLEALRLGMPLHVFRYENTEAAPGNEVLINKGASAILQERKSGAPNLGGLLKDLETRPQPDNRPATAQLI